MYGRCVICLVNARDWGGVLAIVSSLPLPSSHIPSSLSSAPSSLPPTSSIVPPLPTTIPNPPSSTFGRLYQRSSTAPPFQKQWGWGSRGPPAPFWVPGANQVPQRQHLPQPAVIPAGCPLQQTFGGALGRNPHPARRPLGPHDTQQRLGHLCGAGVPHHSGEPRHQILPWGRSCEFFFFFLNFFNFFFLLTFAKKKQVGQATEF